MSPPALKTHLRIGSRGSELARWQADYIAERLRALGCTVEIILIKTRGDLDQRTAFGGMNAKGIFTKEIEDALLAGTIDLAVHSLKDLPTQLPPGLELVAVPERESPLDGWVSRHGTALADLPPGARVATGSLRRQAQILALRPDLEVVPIRGNVHTRLQKIRDGLADATLLAQAGVHRLGLSDVLTSVFSPDQLTPAMGQGALGIEARAGEFTDIWPQLEHIPTRLAAEAERAFIGAIGGGCKTPAGVLAQPREGGGWRVTAVLASPDGRHLLRRGAVCDHDDELGPLALALARSMLAEASPEIRATLSPAEPPAGAP
ncbi:MAG TPA: hydroxymethylbilane synthase [Candidatus Sumerlaeota bacterium]|nr:MAG: Porphobilinogen deaminase [candidate division BRC1 bacterium ADurb.BinA292]HOE95360.1 hydroxymethylbilane synthase [Candidatus Sumerlaeota bacterium]HOR26943.1 hydroxymethylbilane synthase [Candidatus Sumerlaeota bacterium]HPK01071.1 hydroxymethylbilane synthase [Candidatus Sumerlaeota bacterium]